MSPEVDQDQAPALEVGGRHRPLGDTSGTEEDKVWVLFMLQHSFDVAIEEGDKLEAGDGLGDRYWREVYGQCVLCPTDTPGHLLLTHLFSPPLLSTLPHLHKN